MQVAIIGCGYVGLTTGAALAYLGHQVTGVDKDPGKATKIQYLVMGCPNLRGGWKFYHCRRIENT